MHVVVPYYVRVGWLNSGLLREPSKRASPFVLAVAAAVSVRV